MNPLQRALIEKAGNDNGFEYAVASDVDSVTLASARHPARASIALTASEGFQLLFLSAPKAMMAELQRSFPAADSATGGIRANSEATLAALLRRAAGLARSLPNQAALDYQLAVSEELAKLPDTLARTEVERLVRQRVGQQKFREAMLDYWGGSCAVTGVSLPEVLRASHAKPWADCRTDAERLDVFNGFLLTANFDALFDRFLISFDAQGRLVTAPSVREAELRRLGIVPGLRLRWVAAEHEIYLAFHHGRFMSANK